MKVLYTQVCTFTHMRACMQTYIQSYKHAQSNHVHGQHTETHRHRNRHTTTHSMEHTDTSRHTHIIYIHIYR